MKYMKCELVRPSHLILIVILEVRFSFYILLKNNKKTSI